MPYIGKRWDMINTDTLVKYTRRAISSGKMRMTNWVDYTRLLREQIIYIIQGFPGIGMTDISVLQNTGIQNGDRVILDDNLDYNCGRLDTDHAPILGVITNLDPGSGNFELEIEGLGKGTDFSRDPDRLLRWGNRITLNLGSWPTILRVDSKPRPDGGPLYYYFMKHCRDSRW